MKNKKIVVLLSVILVAVIAVAGVVYFGSAEDTSEGSKTITFIVVVEDARDVFEIKTDAEYLGDALQQENLVEGTMGDYGLYVSTVYGVNVNPDNSEWWCFTKDGEMLNTGIDSVTIADGDTFEATFTVGYTF